MVYRVLGDQGFTLTKIDDWTADAERGSLGKSLAIGAFAGKKGRHVKMQIISQSVQDGFTISLIQGSSGFSGGVVGVNQANSIYNDIYDAIKAALQNAGVSASGYPLN